MSITIEEMQKQVHNLAREKGWWPLAFAQSGPEAIDVDNVNIPEKLMLMVSELGEALDFYRDGVGMQGAVYKLAETGEWITEKQMRDNELYWNLASANKPDGFWVEIADTIIRILDLAGAYGINMEDLVKLKHEYNKTRPYRHGNKKC